MENFVCFDSYEIKLCLKKIVVSSIVAIFRLVSPGSITLTECANILQSNVHTQIWHVEVNI